jgi:hypothetical protein
MNRADSLIQCTKYNTLICVPISVVRGHYILYDCNLCTHILKSDTKQYWCVDNISVITPFQLHTSLLDGLPISPYHLVLFETLNVRKLLSSIWLGGSRKLHIGGSIQFVLLTTCYQGGQVKDDEMGRTRNMLGKYENCILFTF